MNTFFLQLVSYIILFIFFVSCHSGVYVCSCSVGDHFVWAFCGILSLEELNNGPYPHLTSQYKNGGVSVGDLRKFCMGDHWGKFF